MPWYYYVGGGLFALIAFGFVLQLLIEVWQQVVMRRYKIPEEIGSIEVIQVANELPQITRKIEPGGWLSEEEYASVDAEIKRRREQLEQEQSVGSKEAKATEDDG